MADIEREKLKLERQRLALETRLKRRDQDFQREQWKAARPLPQAWAQVLSPVGAAVLAGIVGLFGTVINGYLNNKLEVIKQNSTAKLERQKQEGVLILEAIKTAGSGGQKEQQTAANLVFLA